MGLVMCDIDGCVADVRDLASKYLPDWTEYFQHQEECGVISEVVRIVRRFDRLVFYTGRPEAIRDVTEEWLRKHVIGSYQGLLMRPDSATCSTQELKLDWFETYKPVLIIDDDQKVVNAAREAGFTVLQVHGFRWSGVEDFTPGEVVPKRLANGAFSFVRSSAGAQTSERTLGILMYELGRVMELEIKTQVYGPQGYLGDQKIEVGDVASMLRMFCEQKGWDFEEVMADGEEHYLERMKDIREHGTAFRLGTGHD